MGERGPNVSSIDVLSPKVGPDHGSETRVDVKMVGRRVERRRGRVKIR